MPAERIAFQYHGPMVFEHMEEHELSPCPHCGGEVDPCPKLVALPCAVGDPRLSRPQAVLVIALHCQGCLDTRLISAPPGSLDYISRRTTCADGTVSWKVEPLEDARPYSEQP